MADFDFDVIMRALPALWNGLQFTVMLTLVAMSLGIVLGTLLALMRLSSRPWPRRLAGLYVGFMRSTPLVMVIFWFFFLMPLLLQMLTKSERPVQIGPVVSALVTFTLFEAAYYCEIIRGGIQSVSRGQINAAYALGLSHSQAMWHVILPQAMRRMSPVLLTQTIILFQDTSLVYVLSATDFLGAASKFAQRDGRLVELYSFVALVYLVICYVLSRYVKHLKQRQKGIA
jgi:glutamate/aspartate transport system permease protein